MKKTIRHIIQKQGIEIEFRNPDASFSGLQNKITELYYERLQPAMNILFDEIAGDDYLISIDKLEIDSGVYSHKNWEDDWVESTIRKLKAELVTKRRERFVQNVVSSEEAIESFFFFLAHGRLPWNCRLESLRVIEERMELQDVSMERFKDLVRSGDLIVKRLVYSFSPYFRQRLTRIFAVTIGEMNEEIYDVLVDEPGYDDPSFEIAFIKMMASGKRIDRGGDLWEQINDFKQNEFSGPGQPTKQLMKDGQTQDPENRSGTETIFIENAGLVIVHPFLPQLLECLDLTRDNKWMDESSQNKAVSVLQFLATGSDELKEFLFPLNKLLCGMYVDDPVIEARLSEAEKSECERLLDAIIKYWSVLKNTGIDALRETFLQRSGKLSRMDDGWLLQVEQKAFDVLLSSLPWGIGTIRLPWMDEVVYTEWV